jgi:hypothetical protein
VANLDIQNSVMALVIKIKWAVTFNYNYATNIKPLCALADLFTFRKWEVIHGLSL